MHNRRNWIHAQIPVDELSVKSIDGVVAPALSAHAQGGGADAMLCKRRLRTGGQPSHRRRRLGKCAGQGDRREQIRRPTQGRPRAQPANAISAKDGADRVKLQPIVEIGGAAHQHRRKGRQQREPQQLLLRSVR